jgi:RNA polymerase sigma factor (sigma-70 family)
MPDYAAHHARPEADRDDLRFERLIAPLLRDGYALAQALSTDRGAAQDAVQAAALRAWQRMGQLREDAKARAWFLAIVVNECRSGWRKRRALPVDVESRSESIRWPAGIDQRLDVRSAMRQLKRDDRVVLSLRFLMDLSVDETAAVLAISPSAVKARTARAATRFRQLLKDEATS